MTVPERDDRPILALTMGDPAGIGPEIMARALMDSEIYQVCRPLLIGDTSVMAATIEGMGTPLGLRPIPDVPEAQFKPGDIELLDLQNVDISKLKKAQVSGPAGAAAYQYGARWVRGWYRDRAYPQGCAQPGRTSLSGTHGDTGQLHPYQGFCHDAGGRNVAGRTGHHPCCP